MNSEEVGLQSWYDPTFVAQRKLTKTQREIMHDLKSPIIVLLAGWCTAKTFTACAKVLMHSQLFPRSTGILARWTLPEIRTYTGKTFLSLLPHYWLNNDQRLRLPTLANFADSSQQLTFKNGSDFYFKPMDDVSKWGGGEASVILYDDLPGDATEEEILALIGRLRHPKGTRQLILTANPGEEGHWLQRWERERQDATFYRPTLDELVEVAEEPFREVLVQYRKRLESLPGALRERYLYGRASSLTGPAFPGCDAGIHVVEDFEAPEHWGRCVAIDPSWHQTSATCAVGLMVNPQNQHAYIYRHYHEGALLPAQEHGRRMLARFGAQGSTRWLIDPAANAKGYVLQTGSRPMQHANLSSAAEGYREVGIKARNANNDRVGSIARINAWLGLRDAAGRWQVPPRLFFFKSCGEVFEAVQACRLEPRREHEERLPYAKSFTDQRHCVDAVRYAIMEADKLWAEPLPSEEYPGRSSQAVRKEYMEELERERGTVGRPHWMEPEEPRLPWSILVPEPRGG